MAQVVGLDIGTSAVRAAELDLGSSPPTLLAFGQIGIPPGTIIDGEIQDPSAVSDAIGRLWRNGQFASKSVVIGIAGLRAITRELDLPFVPDDEIDSAVRFQSEEVIPFPPDKTILSAQVLADFAAPDGSSMRRVLVAAAHRDLVEGVVEAVERADLQVAGVDLVSSALVRALVDPATLTDQPEAIVSVGAGLTVVVVHQQARPQFVRTIGLGGNATTAAISSTLDLPLADAEAIKRRLGEPIPQVQAAEKAARASTAEIVGEIRNSVQYFASLPGRAPISKVLVTGGASRLQGFVEALQSQMRIPVQAQSPLARLNLSKLDQRPEQVAAIDPVAATPVGLALPEPNPSVQKFNLVPPEVVLRAKQRRVQTIAFAVAALIIVLVAGVSVLRFLQVHTAQNNVNTLNAQKTTLNNEIPRYSHAVQAKKEADTTNVEISGINGASIDWAAVFNAMQITVPSHLAITEFCGSAIASPGAVSPSGGTACSAGSTNGVATTTPTGVIGFVSMMVSGPTNKVLPAGLWLDAFSTGMFEQPVILGTVTTSIPTGFTTPQIKFNGTVSLNSKASVATTKGS